MGAASLLYMSQMKSVTSDVLRQAPKVVLHDHLDGGLRPTTLVELAAEHDVSLPTRDPDELAAIIQEGAASGSLVRYLEPFAYTVGVLRTAEALHRVAAECVVDLAADGVAYAEIRFAPELSVSDELSLSRVVDAVLAGFETGMAEVAMGGGRIEARALLCAMRQADSSRQVAELTASYHRDRTGVVGFDIAGPEAGFPPEDHAEAFAYLRERNVPFTVHAGEAAGVESIAAALEVGAARLGHGVRLIEDVTPVDGARRLGPVAAQVRDRGIALEMCPKSNVDTRAVATLADHPFAILDEAGCAATVNTDNRLMSGTCMTDEFGRLIEHFGYGLEDLERVTQTALDAAFIDDTLRKDLRDNVITPGYAALRAG